ncbi:hypothetical protein [Pontimicrobium aquaticum]|uniref:Restriction endonuclease n=1 Tax=Pontimicrobium aquaticum TaxID=2565367 RepID=A0A4U0F1S9_9FLAO|nr:hypothetical protein [Pontimicrobium aquaticum]TJY38208.1 hypothetical protein E5167_02840 [Pontimicrobium aquaticum]
MPITGTQFENHTKPFFRKVFEEIGFHVLEVRNQTSGTQNGFDIKISFEDDHGIDRSIFIECKYYETTLSFSQIVTKIIELNGSNYVPDGFIALSPKRDISNRDDNLKEQLESSFKFPIKFLTPDSEVHNLFALDEDYYKVVYDEECSIKLNREDYLKKFKARINMILSQKDTLAISNFISISETSETPDEDENLRTTLDEKLDALSPSNEERIRYHQLRCNYKIFLEEQQDLNNALRGKIIDWQDDLRLKAFRLTSKFKSDKNYTPSKFFHDFFQAAENSLISFYDNNSLSGSDEKLLHGVVMELAAECPLDWRE